MVELQYNKNKEVSNVTTTIITCTCGLIFKTQYEIVVLYIYPRIYWCILDGADCNRQFVKIHFGDTDPVEKKFIARNMYTKDPMIFIMDPKVT